MSWMMNGSDLLEDGVEDVRADPYRPIDPSPVQLVCDRSSQSASVDWSVPLGCSLSYLAEDHQTCFQVLTRSQPFYRLLIEVYLNLKVDRCHTI